MNPSLILTKIRLKAGWFANDLRASAGWRGSEVFPFRRILCYHGIDHRGEKRLNSRYLSQRELRKHFEWMRKECAVISLEEYFSQPPAGDKPEICLTFDDGYRNNFDLAYPLLKEFGFPATFFVTSVNLRGRSILWTDHLDLCAWLKGGNLHWQGEEFGRNIKGHYVGKRSGKHLKAIAKQVDGQAIAELEAELDQRMPLRALEPHRLYWELMGEEQLKTLSSDPLIELGTHGLSHTSLGAMPIEEAEREMREGKTWLEALTGKEIQSVAWPSGSYSPSVTQAAYQLGYTRLLLMDYYYPGDAEDPRQAARFVANPHISFLNQREAILKGRYL